MFALPILYSYVATCKFDSRNKVPYSAVLRSLSQILQQILSEPDMKAFYAHVKLSLGTQYSNISMITDFVPELKCLLKAEESKNNANMQSMQTNSIEVRAQFHNLFVGLIRAITRWGMTTLVSFTNFLFDILIMQYPCTGFF